MNKIEGAFIALLRFMFTGEEVPAKYMELTEGESSKLYDISKKHDLAHIIDMAFDMISLIDVL